MPEGSGQVATPLFRKEMRWGCHLFRENTVTGFLNTTGPSPCVSHRTESDASNMPSLEWQLTTNPSPRGFSMQVDMLPDCDQLMLGETALSTALKCFEYGRVHSSHGLTRNGLSYVTLSAISASEFKDALSPVNPQRFLRKQWFWDDTPGIESYIVLAHPDGSIYYRKVLIRSMFSKHGHRNI
jgi:hypothetical protein